MNLIKQFCILIYHCTQICFVVRYFCNLLLCSEYMALSTAGSKGRQYQPQRRRSPTQLQIRFDDTALCCIFSVFNKHLRANGFCITDGRDKAILATPQGGFCYKIFQAHNVYSEKKINFLHIIIYNCRGNVLILVDLLLNI